MQVGPGFSTDGGDSSQKQGLGVESYMGGLFGALASLGGCRSLRASPGQDLEPLGVRGGSCSPGQELRMALKIQNQLWVRNSDGCGRGSRSMAGASWVRQAATAGGGGRYWTPQPQTFCTKSKCRVSKAENIRCMV